MSKATDEQIPIPCKSDKLEEISNKAIAEYVFKHK